MDLNFNQCLVLLIIGFVFALIVCRALLGVANRFLMAIEAAKQAMKGGSGGGKINLMGFIFDLVREPAQDWVKTNMLGKRPK